MRLPNFCFRPQKLHGEGEIRFERILLFCVIFLITIFAPFLCSCSRFQNNYTSAKEYYFFSLYKTRQEKFEKSFVDIVRGLGGAGYELVEGQNTHIVGFVFDNESEVRAARSQFEGFCCDVVFLRAEKLGQKAEKLVFGGALRQTFEFVCTMPQKVKEVIKAYGQGKSEKLIFEFCEENRQAISVLLKTLSSAAQGIEENAKHNIADAISKLEEGLKALQKAVTIQSEILPALNYFLIESALCDIKLREKLA